MVERQAPPSAVRRRTEHGIAFRGAEALDNGREMACCDLRRIHTDLNHGRPQDPCRIFMGVRQPVTKVLASLTKNVPLGKATSQLHAAFGSREITGDRHDPPTAGKGLLAGGKRVEEGGTGEVGGDALTDALAQPGLRLPFDRCLGDDQDSRPHRRTRTKSVAASTLPRSEPETLDLVPSARAPYETSYSRIVHPAAPALRSSSTG